MRKLLLTCGLIAAAGMAPDVASAQNRGTNGSSNTGSSGFGSTGSFGSGSAGSSGFGTTGGSSGLGGASGFGSTGFGAQNGQGANGQTGFGGQNQLGANGNNNGGILGRNTNQNQGILGRNTQNQGAGGNTGLGGGGRGGGGNRGNNGQNSQNGGGGNGANANQTPLVRPRLEIAFDFQLPTPVNIQTTLETRLTKLSVKTPGFKGIMLAIEDKGEVVLRGEVGSASEAKLAETMLRLEPGVRTVRNELTYPTAATPDE